MTKETCQTAFTGIIVSMDLLVSGYASEVCELRDRIRGIYYIEGEPTEEVPLTKEVPPNDFVRVVSAKLRIMENQLEELRRLNSHMRKIV